MWVVYLGWVWHGTPLMCRCSVDPCIHDVTCELTQILKYVISSLGICHIAVLVEISSKSWGVGGWEGGEEVMRRKGAMFSFHWLW